MRFFIITIFPDIFSSYLNKSIIGRAIKSKLISVKFYNPRDFIKGSKSNYKPVDDKPYGGGPGMVMRAEPLLKAVAKVLSLSKGKNKKILVINFIPSAEKLTTAFAKKISKRYTDIILICGRYEGIDARVDKILKTKKLSVGNYVLTGGEIPAMVLIDCVSRQIPGVLGKYESLEEERVSTSEVYTRPEKLVYKGKSYKVPKVLLSGNHKKIEEWKKKK
ncbi:MAG: tRNA (guanine-N(1)-)-methyltransferase [Candidatus Nomurabacteria bacterium GW2011_GWF2_35_12]|uniref:tRNA (guanine-N(1)-)-methyltransferase n=3 Tax=Candidatus Nomuraibacteriota TaxID=1752729 RepID=A0A0G0DYR7_9BACT|nr:MAG: tRNA (guanine-N(1)-)-methyltransferase [Candidatus Nomurabacteria bacterium GW2011_GWF2_35_12]KKP71677.1 MAG: tRNA (guanine-N(1)-)-methyltransferase [Candidatus Nomurabacteria bacterium GW2011_GWB1_35_20]KKP75546.1 MAG: tRNA (guanine-N(1)-)-methyltransferase [Parcubacteria group bacterium GW2011_GWC1_35_21]KKP78641.1 MAG: tRNA (guanine-N(1)-)-methyltransferase [Candidatus Nomurabacteria bacterium GW2011_GWC2_35_35]KKP87645.1 MAG: tRNA (guanine-N(1)-)-methyltransferase [Candidatus Nomura